MRYVQLSLLITLVGLASAAPALASPPVRWSVGVNVGGPAYRPYYPHYHHYPHYYGSYPYAVRPYPVIYPAPVIYEQAPVIVQQAPVVVQSNAPPAFEAPPPTPVQPVGGTVDAHLRNLSHPDDNVRRDSIMELGRSKSESAVEPLTASLAGDKSPGVRDAAARALGLIGSPRALTALIHAAQADPDRDVRHSAQFAVEIIRSNLKR